MLRKVEAPEEPETADLTSAASTAVLKPRCALKVAVVGNRRYAEETDENPTEAAARMKRHAARASRAVWQAVIESLPPILGMHLDIPSKDRRTDDHLPRDLRLADFFSRETPRLAVLSSLAAGGDQIGVKTAFDAARNAAEAAIELEAVLPFPEFAYPGDPEAPQREFRPEEAQALTEMAAQARQVLRLDGRYDDRAGRQAAYEQCREVLLQHADLVLAIYDPQKTGRTGGTVETVGRALALGLPVVAVLVSENEARIALYAAPSERPVAADVEWAGALPIDSVRWKEGLAEELHHLLALPHQMPAPAESVSERVKRTQSLGEAVNRLRLTYGEAPLHRWCRGSALKSVFAFAWSSLLQTAEFFAPPPQSDHGGARLESASADITLAPYAAFYARASMLSDAYMRTYRGAFVLAFALAGVAVAAAVGLMTMGTSPPMLAVVILGGLKIGIILFLLVLERVSHKARYQEHATDFRYLAEQLRPIQWLAPLGAAVPAVHLPAHLAPLDPHRTWMPWLVRAIARSTPPVALPSEDRPASPREVTLDNALVRTALERARSEWLEGQVLYHRKNATRMHAIDEGLERLAKGLLWTVLIFAVGAFLLKLLYQLGLVDGARFPFLLGQFPFLLGAGTAILPAFIAALGGIMFQSEARRLKARSEAMYHTLQAQQSDLEARIAALSSSSRRYSGAAWPTAQHLRALSEIMIEETGDWKVLYQMHEIHAG
ncbi:MAG: hypothetical protein JJT90_05565 [Ectothiorhodospiraceae bacterium]|nr:hypothetical protein [Ectothiorhodospiraceae bacterium]